MTLATDFAILLAAAAYGWRFRSLHGARGRPSMGRLAAFLVGLLALWVAMASPIAQLDLGHLTGHMIQHLLIMTVGAPLVLWAEPIHVLAAGRPRAMLVRHLPSPHPALCWFVGTSVVLFWHVPSVFAFGMRWHGLQHVTFLLAGLLFWLPVIQPWPSASAWPPWSIPLYLFLATLPCDGLSALLAFCGRVVYSHYGAMSPNCPMLNGLSPLEDQQRAAALMWCWVTFAYLTPAAFVTVELLSPKRPATL
ncbi:MAG: cytochrome c oxidase assembly protein [Pseudomonadota bacterium]